MNLRGRQNVKIELLTDTFIYFIRLLRRSCWSSPSSSSSSSCNASYSFSTNSFLLLLEVNLRGRQDVNIQLLTDTVIYFFVFFVVVAAEEGQGEETNTHTSLVPDGKTVPAAQMTQGERATPSAHTINPLQ